MSCATIPFGRTEVVQELRALVNVDINRWDHIDIRDLPA